ncbi:MarR family winged helix-turn-helix transcriptional regulator [Novosphingobium cyanobacteriorum]|uniref:MarR family winged helix-turn-helix transcriptional regulator n=1 Tax=Novosphingobium cyanobacteriorum TaxID=3024215 RepID=A0ABT6CIT2_9SPHN|nr:MarR family winged helix-turn-helix transcriptional regulator [Novosphingobium cyanobacteriorum]MDF8333706.1 MarR family winged helix-turn-helix transcriptional regulator [Novosphingobium cyanobacteriorum]
MASRQMAPAGKPRPGRTLRWNMQASDDAKMAHPAGTGGMGGDTPPADDIALPGWAITGLDYPTFRIGLLAKVMDRLTIRDLMDTDGLTYAEWRVLVRLAAVEDGGTPGRVAELAWADLAEVSRAIGSLERKGLVERHKNPKDLRTSILHLTARGRAQHEATLARRNAFHENLLAGLNTAERAQLDELLSRIGAQLHISPPAGTHRTA